MIIKNLVVVCMKQFIIHSEWGAIISNSVKNKADLYMENTL